MHRLTALAALPPAELIALGGSLSGRHRVAPLALPREGLWLLAMEDAVHRDPFHLGEVPVAEAAVEVEDRAGRRGRGGARLVGASRDAAVAAAVCDAVADGGLEGCDLVHDAVARGRGLLAHLAGERARMRAATRVRFDDLAEGGERDGDGDRDGEEGR